MARPRKNNADYFSHDNNMRNHRKIKAIRNTFGLEGYAVFNMLLETLSECDNFKIKLSNEIDWEILSSDFGIEVERLENMMDYFIKLELIKNDKDTYFSTNLIERLTPLIEKREYLRDKYAEKVVSTTETPVSTREMPHSKVNKSKVKNTSDLEVAEKIPINTLIKLFEPVNPSYEKFYKNKTQRSALERLVKKYGESNVSGLIKYLAIMNEDRYAKGKSITPLEMENNLAHINNHYKQKKDNQRKITKL